MVDFKGGDIVQLKSGGLEMTIQEIVEGGYISCQWFAGNKLQKGLFEPHSLNLVFAENQNGD